MKFILLVLGLILALPMASADIDHFSAIIDTDDGSADFRIRILFDEVPSGEWEYPIQFPVSGLDVTGSSGASCDSIRKSYGSSIVCEFPEYPSGSNLVIRFRSEDVLKRINGEVLFSAGLTVPDDTADFSVRVALAEGLVLIEDGGPFVPYSPVDAHQSSDGRRIFLEWGKLDVPKGEGISMDVVFEQVVQESGETRVALIAVGSVVLVVVLLLSVVAYLRKGTLPMLKMDEEMIVGLIKENHGMVKQNRVVKETGFSKAKVSRMLKDMEERGVIHTKHVGRSNEIYLGRAGKSDHKESDKKKDSK